jgi:hypothetical protein
MQCCQGSWSCRSVQLRSARCLLSSFTTQLSITGRFPKEHWNSAVEGSDAFVLSALGIKPHSER